MPLEGLGPRTCGFCCRRHPVTLRPLPPLAENFVRVVHPQRDPQDGLDEQAPEPGARPGGRVLRAGLGRASVEGKAVRMRHQSGDSQVWSPPPSRWPA